MDGPSHDSYLPNGLTDEFPVFSWKLTRDLSTKHKTVDYITRWLNASALNGIPPFAELYMKHENTGDLKQLEDLNKRLDDIEVILVPRYRVAPE